MNSWRSSAFKDVADHTGFPGFKSPRTERLQKYWKPAFLNCTRFG
jgi:hypothetical protein